MTPHLFSSSSGKALFAPQTGGRSGAEGDPFRQGAGSVGVRGRFALSRAAPSPGLRFAAPEDDEKGFCVTQSANTLVECNKDLT